MSALEIRSAGLPDGDFALDLLAPAAAHGIWWPRVAITTTTNMCLINYLLAGLVGWRGSQRYATGCSAIDMPVCIPLRFVRFQDVSPNRFVSFSDRLQQATQGCFLVLPRGQ